MTRYALPLVLVLAALAFLFAPVVCYGQTCRTGTCAAPTVAVQTYATATYATPILIPTYGVVYAPTYGGTTDETNRLLAELLAEQRALRSEIAALKDGTGPKVFKDPRPSLKANCARCHTEGQLAPGTDFSLFDEKGEPFALSSVDRKAMAKRLQNGTMPPPVTEAGGLKVQRMLAADRAELAGLLLNPPPAPKVSPPVIPPAAPSGASLKLPDVPQVGPAKKEP